ncbi:tetratricopeptide repeat protein [Xanthobacter autotrophicus]|uniref:tetratricopeptide repeat protein n=1 Tax=Xanthobacter autotrophicus TaxID=280 RepID=UPI0024A6CA8B|nr:tetratricopeptide repeat protein [Xanthobacter autotrophicus]MDI4656160.1 tetratricopeptide repeat protein [Xanthobacter autotrophicus]
MSPDVAIALSRAADMHRMGQFEQALAIYRRLAKAHSASFDIQRLLIFELLQVGRPKEAVIAARRLRDAHPRNPHAAILLGASHQGTGNWEKALTAFQAAVSLEGAPLEAHFLAGNAFCALGRYAEGVACYDAVLAADPRSIEALSNRAGALARMGRLQEALRDSEALVALQPWQPLHLVNLAGTLLELERPRDVVAAADAALRLAPRLADAEYVRGQALLGLGRWAEARASLEKAVDLAPQNIMFHARLISVLHLIEDMPAARSACERALRLDPKSAMLLQLRAEIRRAQDDASGAMGDIEAALALDPRLASAHVSRARLLADEGRREDMRKSLGRALEVDPGQPYVQYANAAEKLAERQWLEGWAGYEHREAILPPPFNPLPFTRWDGRETPDMLVALGEQGIGDVVFFGRLLRTLADRGIRTILLTRPGLVPLLRDLDGRVPVVSDLSGIDQSMPGLRWAPIGSLPHLVSPDPARWPAAPYLTPPQDRVSRWRHLRQDGAFNIGINWQGNPSRNVDVGRSIPLALFAPLAAIPGVSLVSLQHGAGTEQLDQVPFAGAIVRPDAGFNADGIFVDTVGLMQTLDLVVTTDTALANVAGACGFPTFVALRAVPDWRWGCEGEETVFFPSLRLFRQPIAGDWSSLIQRMTHKIRELL